MKKKKKNDPVKIPLSGMEKIYDGLGKPHIPGSDNDRDFVDAIYDLFNEYRDAYYKNEWKRIDP